MASSGIPLLVAYNRNKQPIAFSGPDLEKAVSHEAAVDVAGCFIKKHSDVSANPFACPYVQYGIAAGLLLTGAVAAAVFYQRQQGSGSSDSSVSRVSVRK